MNYNKKILLISNNPLSNVYNNGKTLASIIDGIPCENIYQIYFHEMLPDFDTKCHYYQITEKKIIKSIIKNKKLNGELDLNSVSTNVIDNNNSNNKSSLKKFIIFKVIRECIWKTKKWKNIYFKNWIEENNIDTILFLAGDSFFAYDVYDYLCKVLKKRSCMYITDDYILPRKNEGFLRNILRKKLLKKMKNSLKNTDVFLTISEEMQKEYLKIFNKDSLIVRNYTNQNKDKLVSKIDGNKEISEIKIIYAGGLHYNRWKTLHECAIAVKEYNSNNQKKAHIYIYTNPNVSEEVQEKLNIQGCCEICGFANSEEMPIILSEADILLFVESFDEKSVNATRLSFSTKIPEYLSMGKPIVAIGPDNIASMKYLSKCAFCINDEKRISDSINKILNSDNEKNKISINCKTFFQEDFSENNRIKVLNKILGDE